MQVSELEKNLKLRQLRLKGVEHELETERALSSKLYDDVRGVQCSLSPRLTPLQNGRSELGTEARVQLWTFSVNCI